VTVNRTVLFVVAAVVCFAVALLSDLSIVHSNADAWEAGGLLSLALSLIL
jgi:uncharacterized membrane protein